MPGIHVHVWAMGMCIIGSSAGSLWPWVCIDVDGNEWPGFIKVIADLLWILTLPKTPTYLPPPPQPRILIPEQTQRCPVAESPNLGKKKIQDVEEGRGRRTAKALSLMSSPSWGHLAIGVCRGLSPNCPARLDRQTWHAAVAPFFTVYLHPVRGNRSGNQADSE
ncbi:hypothetical protein LZ30DRAFT_448712 [Colletotrichum cereale]|nr:hypothetical protein LZ30DRAFT_448712 [Colletotrichum cereale]